VGIFNFFKKDKEKLPEPAKPKDNPLKSLEEEHGLSTNPLENLKDQNLMQDNSLPKEIKDNEQQGTSLDDLSLPQLQPSQDLEDKKQDENSIEEVKKDEGNIELSPKEDNNVSFNEDSQTNFDEEFEKELDKYKEMLKIEKEEHVNSFLEVEEQPKEKKVKGTLFVKLEVYELMRENSNRLFETSRLLAKELDSFELPLQQQKSKLNLLSKELMDFEDQLLSIDSQIFNKG